MIKTIATEKAPAAVGPYSQGKIVGNILYCAGQGGIDPAVGKIVDGGVQAEAEQACKNVGALLEEAGIPYYGGGHNKEEAQNTSPANRQEHALPQRICRWECSARSKSSLLLNNIDQSPLIKVKRKIVFRQT